MKQILVKKTDSVKPIAGTSFPLLLTKEVLPNLTVPAKALIRLNIPLDFQVLSGGNDWTFNFKISSILAENGIVLLSAEKKENFAVALIMNLSDVELFLEEGLPIIEVSLVQSVSFRQIDQTESPNGVIAVFSQDGVAVVNKKTEERKGEVQKRNARKKKKD